MEPFWYLVEIIKITKKTSLFSIAVLPSPTKLELTLAGKAKEEQSKYGRAGIYMLSNGLVNGYPHWLKTGDGSQAIWFDKVGSNWKIGDKENLGTNTGGIAGPHGKDSYPNEIKQGLRYSVPNNAWQDAGPNDVILKAIGTFCQTLSLQHKFHQIHLFSFTKQHSTFSKNFS